PHRRDVRMPSLHGALPIYLSIDVPAIIPERCRCKLEDWFLQEVTSEVLPAGRANMVRFVDEEMAGHLGDFPADLLAHAAHHVHGCHHDVAAPEIRLGLLWRPESVLEGSHNRVQRLGTDHPERSEYAEGEELVGQLVAERCRGNHDKKARESLVNEHREHSFGF